MRFFNDVFDLGIRDERGLSIVNFFFMIHLVIFMIVLFYVIKMSIKGEQGVFNDEVDKLRYKNSDTKKHRWTNENGQNSI